MNPSLSPSHIISEVPLAPDLGSVFATTIIKSAFCPLVIKVFCPFNVISSSVIFALVLTRRHAVTAQIGIGNLQKFEGTEWGQMAAGAIVLILPAMIIAFFISKYFVQGLTSGATKG